MKIKKRNRMVVLLHRKVLLETIGATEEEIKAYGNPFWLVGALYAVSDESLSLLMQDFQEWKERDEQKG